MSEVSNVPPPSDEEPPKAKIRDFLPARIALEQKTSVMVLTAIITLLGITAYVTIPKEASPEITIPMIAVSTPYPGVSPGDMETLVTRVIEEELNNIPDMASLTSTTVEGYSSIVAEFGSGVDMNEALQRVKDKVDLAKPDLPADALDPMIMEFVLSEFPIMQVNISGEYSLVQLKDVAENLQDELEQIPSILEVRLSGGLEREVKVDVDLPKLQYYGLGIGDVVSAIAAENLTIPGGSIDVGNQKYLVRVDGEFRDTRVIQDIVVKSVGDQPIYIRDVATVDFGFQERASYARLNANPVVTLDIIKRTGENIIATADAVRDVVAEAESNLPPTTEIAITSDQSEQISMMVSGLQDSIISGLILVVGVLLFFLGVRNSAIVALSIPLSMLMAFIIMQVMGISLNMVVLFSLILALGMLVDDAIVVFENIHRFREAGHDNWKAARLATGEVAIPVITSTLTTIAAFAPLLFWPGITGEFMRYLPLTVILALSSSLFVALVIIPVLAVIFLRLEKEPKKRATRATRWTLIGATILFLVYVASQNLLTAMLFVATGVSLVLLNRFFFHPAAEAVQNRLLPGVLDAYERRLNWALDRRWKVIGGTGAVFVATFVAFGFLNAGVEFFPESIPPPTVYVQIDVPSGTNAAFTNTVAEEIEHRLNEVEGIGDAETIVATIRESTGGTDMFSASGGSNANVAVNFVKFQEREHDVFDTLESMQETMGAGIAGAEVTVAKPANGPSTGAPINIEISGDDPAVLRRLGDEAVARLRAWSGADRLEGLESDMTTGRPELVVQVDRERAALYGLNTRDVGMVIRNAIQGVEAAKFREGEDEYDIIVRLAEPYRADLNSLQDLTVPVNGRQIPLPSVASWRTEEGAGTVIRKELKRVVTVSSQVRAGENTNAVLADVQTELQDFAANLPAGYVMSYTGQQQDQIEAMQFLVRAFMGALILIALILITQFNSVVKPFIIMTSVLMSTVGVLVGLMIFRMPFGIIMTGVGVIALAGVVVKNGIIMIDYIDILQERDGLSRREALVRAGRTRFRPVILTATTAVLGLVPLAIGFNFNFVGFYTSLEPELFWGGEQAAWWAPMAIAIIVGLSFATVLTLVIVPVLYSLADDFSSFFARHYVSGHAAAAADAETGRITSGEARPRRRRIPVQAFGGLLSRRTRSAE